LAKGDGRRPEAEKGAYERNYDSIFGEGAFYRDDAYKQRANMDALDNLDAAKNAKPDEEASPGKPADEPVMEGGEVPPDPLTDE
jgi:hypothetical protein